MNFSSNITSLINDTPLIKICDDDAVIYAKCEHLNPGLSLKDRIAKHMIEVAFREYYIRKGSTIVCASSGNTGYSISMLAAYYKINSIIITTEKCSNEKRDHIKSTGAKLIVRPESDYMSFAKEYAKKHSYYCIDQYNTPANPQAYYESLGPEIWNQTKEKITHFVMTGSTFGCICGTAKYLKEQNPKIKIILADPEGSNIGDYFKAFQTGDQSTPITNGHSYLIEGAGKSGPTDCLDFSLIDEVVKVNDQEAISTCYQLARENGLNVGGSSGLNVYAAKKIASKLNPTDVVVTILCDHGIKYLSKLYNPTYLHNNDILTY